MRDQVLGTTQPVLSISLDPGESVIARVGDFAWMTDSIQVAVPDAASRRPPLCVYTATCEPGVVAFAAKLPGSILGIDVGREQEGYLVRRSGFVAGTPGVHCAADPSGDGLALWRIGGSGRAWVELPGGVLRRELAAGQSLRVRPRHVGMLDLTVAVQVAEVRGISGPDDTYRCAVLSGPGAVWLQSGPAIHTETTQ